MCGLAGVLLANHTDFISPAMMHWTRSGDLIVMVVLGGMGSLFGPTIGAIALLLLEEALPHMISIVGHVVTGRDVATAKEYWQLILGPMLLLVVLFARGGINGLLAGARRG
jgi:branched-chain amino acid transport system permease protein